MITIKEPNALVLKLWGKSKNRIDIKFRLLKYIIKVDIEDGVLLHNVVTGQLILIPNEEKPILDAFPGAYVPIMDELIDAGFAVPDDCDEFRKVIQLRTVLHAIEDNNLKAITMYTILPTTACNARCFYCFEAGIETVTMTQETADEVVSFIKEKHQGKDISIRWFCGEPTVGNKIIDRICEGLTAENINYTSDMISNGYLFDDRMVEKAASLWHLKHIQITLDGTEEIYNRVKAYVNVSDNPYHRVLRNVGLLLQKGIRVSIRMNVDRHNSENLKDLLKELSNIFHGDSNFAAYAWPVFGDCGYDPAIHDTEDNLWLAKKIVELNNIASSYGFYPGLGESLPAIKPISCMADNNATIVIRPGGELVRCLEKFDDDSVVGNVKTGITDMVLYQDWKELGEYQMCMDCIYFPRCMRLKHCGSSELCYEKDKYVGFTDVIKRNYLSNRVEKNRRFLT